MQRITNAAIGITLALASTALSAASFDATRGTYDDRSNVQPPPVEATAVQPMATISEQEAPSVQPLATIGEEPLAAPVTREALAPEREREELAPQRRELAYNEAPAYAPPRYDPRHPQTGQLIERGLFNRTGPNDFGA